MLVVAVWGAVKGAAGPQGPLRVFSSPAIDRRLQPSPLQHHRGTSGDLPASSPGSRPIHSRDLSACLTFGPSEPLTGPKGHCQ